MHAAEIVQIRLATVAVSRRAVDTVSKPDNCEIWSWLTVGNIEDDATTNNKSNNLNSISNRL